MLNPLAKVVQYKYTITLIFFITWMIFFDGNSLIFMKHQHNELQDLRAQEEFLKSEIVEMTKLKTELFSDDDKLERYARENFYFKKDDEDVFVIEEAED